MHPKSLHNQAPDLANLDTNPSIKLGLAIRHQRKQQNKTLTQLADQIGTDAGNLSRIERGNQTISPATLNKICLALGCSPAQLYAQQEGENFARNAKLASHSAPQFVSWFRSVAPYIHAFGGRTFVIAFGGEVVTDGQFTALSHDLNLLASLEVRLILVHGARPQIESKIGRAHV